MSSSFPPSFPSSRRVKYVAKRKNITPILPRTTAHSPEIQMRETFKLKYGHIGQVLAKELVLFSFDLVGVVAAYSQELRLVREMGIRSETADCSPLLALDNDGNIFIQEGPHTIVLYKAQGDVIHRTFDTQELLVYKMVFSRTTNQLWVMTSLDVARSPRRGSQISIFNIFGKKKLAFVIGKITSPVTWQDMATDSQGMIYTASSISDYKAQIEIREPEFGIVTKRVTLDLPNEIRSFLPTSSTRFLVNSRWSFRLRLYTDATKLIASSPYIRYSTGAERNADDGAMALLLNGNVLTMEGHFVRVYNSKCKYLWKHDLGDSPYLVRAINVMNDLIYVTYPGKSFVKVFVI